MNQIKDMSWGENLEKCIENDWYVVPVAILFGIVALIALVGADNFIEVMSEFIVGIRAN
jgi:hypothetical protein